MAVNSGALSQDCDETRRADLETIRLFGKNMAFSQSTRVLDFGSGAGNFACLFKKVTGADVYGAEPSDEMREQALAKGCGVSFRKGNHAHLPFNNSFFDFIYMTDVIHHVPDLAAMFRELLRVLKPEGKICVVTQSHAQTDVRVLSLYFAATAGAGRARYPDIEEILARAEENGFVFLEAGDTAEPREIPLSEEFMAMVCNKGYSVFRLIDEDTYQKGLARLEADFAASRMVLDAGGENFLWFAKA